MRKLVAVSGIGNSTVADVMPGASSTALAFFHADHLLRSSASSATGLLL